MKVRLISKSGDGIGLAHRIQQEGHEVDFYLADEKGEHLYDGILPRVTDWKKGLAKDTIIIVDMVGFGKEADKLREQGYKVVGGSEIADNLELDRMFGLQVAENAGIEVPYSEDFQDFDKGIEFLEKQEEESGWVFKPEHNKEGVRTFVSQSIEQMQEMLLHAKEVWKGKVDYVLQKVVEGVEVSSEVWCVEGQIVPNSYNNTLEQKRFLNDNLGPNTGCMGSTVKFNLCPRLYTETFKKLEKWLASVKYTGPLDINCIIDYDGKPYMLEWTSRFGYSAVYAMLEGLNMEVGEFLSMIAGGEIPDLSPLDEWCGALRLTMPPYPHVEDAPEAAGLPVIGLDLESLHVWPLDVMQKGESLQCSGFDSIVCELTAADENLANLWYRLLADAKDIQIPEVQYRTDIFADVQRRVNELVELGYADESVQEYAE